MKAVLLETHGPPEILAYKDSKGRSPAMTDIPKTQAELSFAYYEFGEDKGLELIYRLIDAEAPKPAVKQSPVARQSAHQTLRHHSRTNLDMRPTQQSPQK